MTDPTSRSERRRRASRHPAKALAAVATVCALGLLAGCTGGSETPAAPSGTDAPAASAPAAPSAPVPAPALAPTADIAGIEVAGRIEGFQRPWDLRFLPDGTPLVTERPGQLATVVDGRRQVVDRVPDVVARGEGGLMGLALDPSFERNRRIYLCYSAGSGDTVRDVRVVRYRLTETLDGLRDPTPIVTGLPAGAGNRHLGCRVDVGPDGMLWVTAGDAVSPTAPQDPTSRAGKVLRATLAGDPAPDNPGGGWDPYVYTLGHRNVQGLSFRPGDRAPFSVEHGTGCDDEINLLVAGGNYGWNPVGAAGRYAEDAPMTSPDISAARAAVWSSGCPTIAPSGAEFITGAQWGRWSGALAVAVLKDQELLLVALDGDTVTDTRTELSGALGRLRTVRNAPDGSLWLTVDADGGAVVRVVPRT
ncbi:MAG: PQQ-dependent sugar dehydrogenase [Candidatus Nanopelagicales bacterium]